MIKKFTNFFCVLPLITALTITHVIAEDHANNPPAQTQEKEKIKDCIEKIRVQQNKIKNEVEKIKKLIKDRKNPQGKDQA